MSCPDCLKLKHQLCFPLYACSKELTRRYAPYLEPLNLTYTQYIVMLLLWETGPTTVTKIGRTLLLDSGTLTPLLKKLEAKGYLTRARNLNDERSVDIALTPTGEALKRRAKSIPAKVSACLGLTPAEAQTLHFLTTKLLHNLTKE